MENVLQELTYINTIFAVVLSVVPTVLLLLIVTDKLGFDLKIVKKIYTYTTIIIASTVIGTIIGRNIITLIVVPICAIAYTILSVILFKNQKVKK